MSASISLSMHGGDESAWRKKTQNLHRRRTRIEYGTPERDSQTHRDPEVQEVRPRRGKGHLAERIRPDECLVADLRIKVEVQKLLQVQRMAKQNAGTCVDLGLGGLARKRSLDVHTTAKRYGGETDLVCDKIGDRRESLPDHRESNVMLWSRRK